MAFGKAKLYLLVALAFVLGVFGLRFFWIQEGIKKQQDKRNEDRLKAIKKADEVENEVEALNPDDLRKRASKWVR
jgi:hypothetical protein